MVKLDSEELNKMREVLEVTNGQLQLVTYFGVAEAIVSNILSREGFYNNDSKLSLRFDKDINMLGEISIIDRDLLKSCIRKVYNLRTILSNTAVYDSRLRKVGTYNSMLELLGVTDAYSNDDIYTINRHFSVYRNALSVTLKLLEKSE